MTILVVPPGVLYQAPPKPPLLIHLLTSLPTLASQQQRIFADSRAVASTIRIHRLTWFGWNQVLMADTRW